MLLNSVKLALQRSEENQIRNGKNDNRPGPASGPGANGPVGGQGSGAVRGGRPGGVPERKPAGKGAGPVELKAPVKVEIKKEQGNGLQGNDGAVLPEGLPTDSRGPEGQPGEGSQRAGEGEGSEAGGTDGGGQRDRAGDVRPDQSRPDDSVKKNTRNNRVSRGETVYPKTPAARYRANLAANGYFKENQSLISIEFGVSNLFFHSGSPTMKCLDSLSYTL